MTFSFVAVFTAGLLTFLSPCLLPVAPILVAGLVAVDDSRWARLRATTWFVVGFATVFVLLGLAVPTVVSTLKPIRPMLVTLAAAALVLFGLKMMRVLGASGPLAWMERSFRMPDLRELRPRGLQGLMLGALFGLTWTPCAGPILGGVLTYVATQQGEVIPGALLLLVYAAGMAVPLLLIAVASEYVTPLLRPLRGQARTLEFVSGLALVMVGVLLLGQIHLRAGSSGEVRAIGRHPGGATFTSGERRRVLFFHSAHCASCRAMEAYLPKLQRDCRSEGLELARINVDRAENAPAIDRFAVRAVPTVSLLGQGGEEIVRLVGYQTEAALREAVQRGTRIACAGAASPSAPDRGAVEASTCAVGKPC